MPPTHIVVVAFSSASVRLQANYALLSALAFGDDATQKVHLFTDDASAFASLHERIRLHTLDDAALKSMRGAADYPFRIKIAALEQLSREFPNDNLLFVDADGFFTAPVERVIARIGPRDCVLHVKEYDVATHPTGQLQRFRRTMTSLVPDVDLNIAMWNSGVIGIGPAQTPALKPILTDIDRVAPHFKKGLVEQFFVSLHLARIATVHASSDEVLHYWAQKSEYEAAIRARLNSWQSLSRDATLEELRTKPLRLPPPLPKRKNLIRRLWERVTEGAPLSHQ